MTHRRAVVLMILCTLLWSIAGVVTRYLEEARSFEVTFWRSLFNALALIVALSVMRGATFWRGFARAGWPVWVSGCCWATMYTAFMVAMTLTTVADVLVTLSIGPLITALFSRVILGHRLPVRTWFAIALAGCGIAWMFGQGAMSGTPSAGTLVALCVPLAAATNWTVLQFVAQKPHCLEAGSSGEDMMPAVLIGASLSALATLPMAYPFQASLHDQGLLALLGVVQLAIPCLLVVRLTRELPAAEIALLGLLEILFGVAWAWLFASEAPSSATLIGGTMVIGALVFNGWLGLKQTRSQEAKE